MSGKINQAQGKAPALSAVLCPVPSHASLCNEAALLHMADTHAPRCPVPPSLLSHPHRVILPHSAVDLCPEDVGGYYSLDSSRVPEAFRDLNASFYAPLPQPLASGRTRPGGCPGALSFFAATGQQRIMHRKCMHDLWAALTSAVAPDASDGTVAAAGSSPRPRKLLLTGASGAGKSVALLGLVERARASGWCVSSSSSVVTAAHWEGYRPQAEASDRMPSPHSNTEEANCACHAPKLTSPAHTPSLSVITPLPTIDSVATIATIATATTSLPPLYHHLLPYPTTQAGDVPPLSVVPHRWRLLC